MKNSMAKSPFLFLYKWSHYGLGLPYLERFTKITKDPESVSKLLFFLFSSERIFHKIFWIEQVVRAFSHKE